MLVTTKSLQIKRAPFTSNLIWKGVTTMITINNCQQDTYYLAYKLFIFILTSTQKIL